MTYLPTANLAIVIRNHPVYPFKVATSPDRTHYENINIRQSGSREEQMLELCWKKTIMIRGCKGKTFAKAVKGFAVRAEEEMLRLKEQGRNGESKVLERDCHKKFDKDTRV